MTTEQIEATAGGELLRQEAASFTQVECGVKLLVMKVITMISC